MQAGWPEHDLGNIQWKETKQPSKVKSSGLHIPAVECIHACICAYTNIMIFKIFY